MREGDDDAVAAVDEALQLVLRLGEAAGGDRGPLRLERERLRLREGVELGGALERDRLEPFLGPNPLHLVRLPDEVRGAVEHVHEVARNLRFVRLLVVVEERRLGEIGSALDGGIDHGAVDRMQRSLGEGRERAHLLDLVAVELDPERLAARRREDVDEPTADSELAALLGTLDALVARESELLREPVEAGLGSDLEPDRLRPLRSRRDPLGECGRGRGDEAAAREHVEGARTLADEMRRRLEAGAPADAAPGQERDALGADEPARRLGEVARVGILGKQHDEPALELLVQGREHQRQHRLRDARPGRQRSGERLQALEREQLPDERVEYRTVHDDRRKPEFPPPPS